MTILDLSVLDSVTGGTAFSGSSNHGTLLPRPQITQPKPGPLSPSPFNPNGGGTVPLGPFTPSDPHSREV